MNATSNGIQARQNEASNVAKLVAADRLYREVKRLNFLQFLFAVVLPLVFALVLLPYQGSNLLLLSIPNILAVFCTVLSVLFKPVIDGKTTLAADIKQDFDVSVYQMPWSEDLFGEKRNLTGEIAEKSAGSSGDTFRNWYRPEADAMPLQDGIFACQRENYAWDGGLRGRYRNLCVGGIGALILTVVAVEIYKNESAAALLAGLVFILSAVGWLLNIVGGLGADLKRLDKMKASFQSADARTMKDLQKIQKALYEHRKRAVIPPGFLYRLFKDSDEETARHMMEMESWGKKA